MKGEAFVEGVLLFSHVCAISVKRPPCAPRRGPAQQRGARVSPMRHWSFHRAVWRGLHAPRGSL